MSTNDGGPAFPQHPDVGLERFDGKLCSLHGMTLRDYFAAKAMQGLCAFGHDVTVNHIPVVLEVAAYKIADAMLKAREVKP